MMPTASAATASRRTAILLVLVMCGALLPLTAPVVAADGRDASILVTAIPTALEVNPGEAGEYTIRVRNTGSNPVTVSMATSEEATQECNAYTSSITQIPGPIDAGSYEEATMNITLTQTAEGSCDTTVTVTANEQATPPDVAGAPAQESVTVTTTAGDGSGSAVFGVDLIITDSDRSKDWNGEEEIDYRIEVENTGQTNQTVSLTVNDGDGPGCASGSGFTVTLSETSVNVDQEESEIVFATVEVPEGATADKYCWEVTGTVTNDPSQEARDTEEFDLTVPQLKKCTVALSKTSVSVNPDDETKITATYANDGNADWTVYASPVGSKSSWVQADGASSGLLPYDGGNGERAFDFIVSPDDSVTAGSETVVQIVGKDGNNGPIKCKADLRIIVGQSRGASISVANALLSNIEPGSNKSTTLTITNQGNGQDNLRVASSIAPTGWAVQLDASSVSVGSRHGNEKSANVGVTVRVPANALATEEVELIFSVLPSSGGTAYDTVTLRVTVAAIHAMEIETPATDQTGRSGTEVRFPIDLVNEGNVRDTIGLSVVSQTASPRWDTSFENEDGMPLTEIDVDPQTTTTVYLVVSIDGEEELENTRRDFVANVSHELRTPLSLIKGFTETLMDGAVDDPKKNREFLQTIDKHADRLGYLIDDLLTLAQLDSDKLAMNRQPTSLHAVAKRVENDLQAKADKRSIDLKTDIPVDLYLDADGDRLQQAVFNLVDNAIKYGRTGGTVTIEGRLSTKGMAEVAVEDDGEGIPPESVEKVFERFFRVDKARSRETGGTGLGLAIVKHIVHSHGGKVRLESRIGQGARFILSLPLAAESGEAA